jgi:hypothetical protein
MEVLYFTGDLSELLFSIEARDPRDTVAARKQTFAT